MALMHFSRSIKGYGHQLHRATCQLYEPSTCILSVYPSCIIIVITILIIIIIIIIII